MEFLHCSYPQAYTRVSFVVSISLIVVNHLLGHLIAPSQLLGSHPSFSVFLSQSSLASTQASRGVPCPPSLNLHSWPVVQPPDVSHQCLSPVKPSEGFSHWSLSQPTELLHLHDWPPGRPYEPQNCVLCV